MCLMILSCFLLFYIWQIGYPTGGTLDQSVAVSTVVYVKCTVLNNNVYEIFLSAIHHSFGK